MTDFGTVVAGLVVRGVVREGAALRLGPDAAGDFVHTTVTSIQRSCVAVSAVEAGQHGTFALRDVAASAVRRGMVLVQRAERTRIARQFTATVEAVSAPASAVRTNTVGMLHIGSVRQAAVVGEVSTTADTLAGGAAPPAQAVFYLARTPEYLAVGDRFLFRCSSGFVKGEVTALVPIDVDPGIPPPQQMRKFSPPRTTAGIAPLAPRT